MLTTTLGQPHAVASRRTIVTLMRIKEYNQQAAEVVLELLLWWNRQRSRPPLDDDEVAQVVASITHLHDDRTGLGRDSYVAPR